ncbi:metallophosphoesterase [Carboxylicivirga sp. N1Y90]|uniref:metallophosphoesterase n=1 Tax=Carboxylicivirga fragile TaxID=3417571 RepID=UPI003D34511C|nr:metallophosphoesterase [Marinilabiliaceae bacterium N1Y90]
MNADITKIGYDIIGDIHGYYGELKLMLQKLGYSSENGYWSHKENRIAVFIGDFINRGSNSREVISCIREMVENGAARAILGNHEINAITYFTKRSDGRPIKMPSNGNRKLLDRFAFEYGKDLESLMHDIKWMRTLPLYLNLDDIRVVHAYWNDQHITQLHQLYEGGRLRKKHLKEAVKKDTLLYRPFMETIKGIEFNLPDDLIIKDSNNITRRNFRVKWWLAPHGQTFRSLSYGNKFSLPNYTIPSEIISNYKVYPENAKTVFIGHYCAGMEKLIPAKNICCVDACVANGGKLAAYRHEFNQAIDEENFVFIDKK